MSGNTDIIRSQFHRLILIPLPPVILGHFILNEFVKTPFNSSNSHVVAFASKSALCYQLNEHVLEPLSILGLQSQ